MSSGYYTRAEPYYTGARVRVGLYRRWPRWRAAVKYNPPVDFCNFCFVIKYATSMAETDDDPAETTSSSHVVIDVDEAAAGAAADEAAAAAAGNMSSSSSCSCAVCMEPMEWVAVFPCGHRDVCARCAAQLRFFHNDRRCCICRSYCATVVVTRADDDDRATTTTSQRERPFLSPPPPPAFGGQQARLQVGVNYWYHRDMGAYFDDLSQYQEMCRFNVDRPLSRNVSNLYYSTQLHPKLYSLYPQTNQFLELS